MCLRPGRTCGPRPFCQSVRLGGHLRDAGGLSHIYCAGSQWEGPFAWRASNHLPLHFGHFPWPTCSAIIATDMSRAENFASSAQYAKDKMKVVLMATDSSGFGVLTKIKKEAKELF